MSDSKSTHTPLPWRHEDGEVKAGEATVARADRGPNGFRIKPVTRDANMAFIVRACNAHEELLAVSIREEAHNTIPGTGRDADWYAERQAIGDARRAAVAKATGGGK